MELGGDIQDTEDDWGVGNGTNPGDLGEDLRTEYTLPSNAEKIIGPGIPETPINCID